MVDHTKVKPETLQEKIRRVLQDEITVVPYDAQWPQHFQEEKDHLLSCLPHELIGRIEHFGSTAVPGVPAKPIIDILVEVTDLHAVQEQVVPILETQGYDYFWRPTWGDDVPPFYAWFIKRDSKGNRTHHIHMVEPHFEHWDSLFFRDYLREHPDIAEEYATLKFGLAEKYSGDRVAYTSQKTDFIARVTEEAKRYYKVNIG
ncbi:MAG: GrpB family protein [Deltaproteobacteria bacterium]|nr:GrpB family protein [Deltaproteobacteria bacterium]